MECPPFIHESFSSGFDWEPRIQEVYTKYKNWTLHADWSDYLKKFQKALLLEMINHVRYSIEKCDRIRHCLRPLKMLLSIQLGSISERKVLDQYTFNLFMELLVKHCKNSVLVADFLKELFSISVYKPYIFLLSDAGSISYILYHAQKARFNLWGVLPAVPDQTVDKNDLANRLLVKDSFQVVSTLIKYGFPIERAVTLRCAKRLLHRRRSFVRVGPFTIFWDTSSRRKMLINQIVYFVVMSAMKNITLEDAQECIQLIWRSVPDAYPTTSELEIYMAKSNYHPLRSSLSNSESHLASPKNRVLELRRKAVSIVSNFFKENVSGDASYSRQPRSLQHLCRCAIRKQLSGCYQLPGGIHDLELPKKIEEYLQLNF